MQQHVGSMPIKGGDRWMLEDNLDNSQWKKPATWENETNILVQQPIRSYTRMGKKCLYRH